LIEGKDPSSGARKFTLTTEGERTLEIVLALKNEVLSLTESIFSP